VKRPDADRLQRLAWRVFEEQYEEQAHRPLAGDFAREPHAAHAAPLTAEEIAVRESFPEWLRLNYPVSAQ
jgi:hypothetical protein